MTATAPTAMVPVQDNRPVVFKDDIETWGPMLAQVAPKWFGPERIIAAALQAAVHQPELRQVTKASLYLALMKVARWALDIGEGVHLVPLQSKGKLIVEAWPDYKGLKALAIRQGIVRGMEEQLLYHGDEFDWQLGLDAYLRHRPCPVPQRKAIRGAYTIIQLPRGLRTFNYMPIEDIEARRATSRAWSPRAGHKEPIGWYAKKTVVRDWLNRQPKTGALAEALASDDTEEPELEERIDPETGEVLNRREVQQLERGDAEEPEGEEGELPFPTR